jgi:hypothetical protein
MKNGQDAKEPEEGTYEWLLKRHRTGISEEKTELIKWLRRYWERHHDYGGGLHDKTERIFRYLLFDKEQIMIEFKPHGSEDKTPLEEKEGFIWNEKKEADFSYAFFIIILTMRNRRHWWVEKEQLYDLDLPDNLRTVLKHWSKQIADILEPDALSQAIYRMNNINYLALAASNIERSRRLRISESSTNINNAIVEQLIDAAEKYWGQVEDLGNKTPLYVCDNEDLGVVIQLQRILSLSRTSNHQKTVEDSIKLKDKIKKLENKKPNNKYLKIVRWWTLYVIYRSKMTTNKKNSAEEEEEEMNKLEGGDDTKYLASLFTKNPFNETNVKSNSVLRNILRELNIYYEARKRELEWKTEDKNMNRKSNSETLATELKDAWKKNGGKKNSTILYSLIHSGRKENSRKRRILKTPSRKDFTHPHLKVERIKRQISSVYEAIEIICSRDHHLAPMQMLLLLHDFMYRMEDEFYLLSTKKRRKQHPPLWDIRDWIQNSCCNMLIGVLNRFKIEIENPRISLDPDEELGKAITFWISELKKASEVNEDDEKKQIKIICKGVAEIFCTAVYGDQDPKTGKWDTPKFALYYNKEDVEGSKCFTIYGPARKLAGEAPLNMQD